MLTGSMMFVLPAWLSHVCALELSNLMVPPWERRIRKSVSFWRSGGRCVYPLLLRLAWPQSA